MGSFVLSKKLSPRHLNLRYDLFRRWKTAGLRAGDKIESQNEITKFCDFSMITVTKTLKDLEADGIIRRQVGKGSFLIKTPWAAAHQRVGFFYNRDIVGGGIFDNSFYTRMVIAVEKGVVSDGHEFILGSFTNNSMPIHIMDALDSVILTGMTEETSEKLLKDTTSQVSLFIDVLRQAENFNSFRIDFGDAFANMFQNFNGMSLRYLYLDSEISSAEQVLRLKKFKDSHQKNDPGSEINIISVNQEIGVNNTAFLHSAITEFRPDVVCGYLHRDWHETISGWSHKKIKIYGFQIDALRPGFSVDTDKWIRQILPLLYENLTNRKSCPINHIYNASFNP